MADNLVIVESPAKAKTIKKYLGRDFEVLASYGHMRDLVPKEGAVDPDDGFRMKYQLLDKNERHVEAIARALHKAKALYLATDPDREGEAIAWPSRSGSVARYSAFALCSARAMASTCRSFLSSSWYFMRKPSSGSTAPSLGTRSRMCP